MTATSRSCPAAISPSSPSLMEPPTAPRKKVVDLTGLAAVAPEDPEPEFVDINAANQVVVTLQENNHIAIVDLASGKVVANFSAGAVDVDKVDTEKNGVIELTGSKSGVAREPDAVQWIGDDRFVTANEGDWKGGSRGFTIFNKDGTVDFDSGAALDHLAVRLGHYPEGRNKKGSEPEGAEVADFGGDKLIFIGTERASLVAVYKDEGAGKAPTFLQALPGGIGPEGLLAIPARNLFVTAAETDLRADGLIGSVVTIYQRGDGEAAYPTIVSADDADGLPLPWAAISGAAADPKDPGKLYVVTDSAFSTARILTVDATKTPAMITGAVTVTRDGAPAKLLDLEGIAIAADGGFWLASEGNPEREKDPTQSSLIKVGADGAIVDEIALPEHLARQATRFGFEGVTVTGTGADQTIWLAVQREWKDDPKGKVKLLAYKPADKSWGVVRYPLDAAPDDGWVGLSEITATDDGLVLIERDNQVGAGAKIKKLTYVPLAGVVPASIDAADIPEVRKVDLSDLIPMLAAPHGYILDKVESFAIDSAGDAYVITDNDGVDDHSGETQFLRLGKIAAADVGGAASLARCRPGAAKRNPGPREDDGQRACLFPVQGLDIADMRHIPPLPLRGGSAAKRRGWELHNPSSRPAGRRANALAMCDAPPSPLRGGSAARSGGGGGRTILSAGGARRTKVSRRPPGSSPPPHRCRGSRHRSRISARGTLGSRDRRRDLCPSSRVRRNRAGCRRSR